MATRKTATAKPVNEAQPHVDVSIPEGFVTVTGASAPIHDFEVDPVLQGNLIGVKVVQINSTEGTGKNKTTVKKDTRLATVKKTNGTVVGVWESAGLASLFNEAKVGYDVFIQYAGRKPLEGGRTFKEYVCAYKPGQTALHDVEEEKPARRK